MMVKGPLTSTSAFSFENYYSELRNSFQPGTKSPLKQMLQATILKRKFSTHTCEKSIFICQYDTALECNTLIYTYDGHYKIYKIKTITENTITCNYVQKETISFPETPNIKWEDVGVFGTGPINPSPVTLNINEIKGKVIPVINYFITCPINVLREK